MSDVPIKFQRPVRKAMIAASKVKKWSFGAVSKVLKGVKLGDFAPETPSIANFTTGEVMGVSSDRLAAKFGVSREDQDRFTVRSHVNAAKAHAAGLYADELVPGVAGNDLAENGIKGDSTYEKVSKLKPAFVKPHGTHTAANSSFLTDGASASLIMSEEKALALGYKPKAYLRHWTFAAVDPFEEMLLGPTYAVNKMLAASGLGLKDIDVIEMHEAFAGQVLANFAALDSDAFAQKNLGRSAKVGAVDMDRVNILGGSLALGHPFGATGSRLVTTASNRLQRDGGRFALIAACADGGIGHSCILERYPN